MILPSSCHSFFVSFLICFRGLYAYSSNHLTSFESLITQKLRSAKVILFFSLKGHFSKSKHQHAIILNQVFWAMTRFVCNFFLKLSQFLDLNFKILFILSRYCFIMLVIFFHERWDMEALFQKVCKYWRSKTAICLNDGYFSSFIFILM